ncbi:hypothetical protein GOP47_0011157 [Adiantum capillus-veneris]|uniref:K Homology domain-containing protein n=1 Tax=Adiantum capillus-veneris TaxID=13818 RepID=A0A9D4US82_ADICA|nr:hypothetical protein GOP47_0011157 [Adiantum capillus-veneris]
MILSNLSTVRLNCWKLPGRHCPRTPPQFPLQGNILHLAQRKYPPATTCFRVRLNFELLMEDSMVDGPCSNIAPPSETHECTASVQIGASVLRFIVGKGGKVKEKIEKDTITHLQIPPPREAKRGSCLVVKGSSQANIDDAVSQIHRVLEEAAESPSLEYSHFISLPLAVHPDLVVQVNKFHDSVMALFPAKDEGDFVESSRLSKGNPLNPHEEKALEDEKVPRTHTNQFEEPEACESEQVDDLRPTSAILNEEIEWFKIEQEQSKEEHLNNDDPEILKEPEEDAELLRSHKKGHGIEESIFIKPATLHLTVLMLKLWSKERLAIAAEVLKGLNSKLLEVLNHRPVAVRLKGVECMRGSPAKAHVLYARVEDADKENRLLCACNVIKDAYVEAGLVSEKDKKQELKLHATLMNSSHRKRKRGKTFARRTPFDARPILSVHGSDEWGEYTITEAHLSERFVYDEDGYYHCCGSVKFPPSALLI